MEGDDRVAGGPVPDHFRLGDQTEGATKAKEQSGLPNPSSAGEQPLIPLSSNVVSELNTQLLSAATKGNSAEVQSLLEKHAEINTKDDLNGRTALHLAARNNRLQVVQQLLLHNPELDVNIQDEVNGLTALGIAVTHGFESIVKALLDHPGVELNTKDKDNQRTPLHLAIRNGKNLVAEALLETGKVEINAKDKLGLTPLHLAARGGHLDIVQKLLDNGAKADEMDEDENSPLHFAARAGYSTIVNILLRKEAKVDIRNKAEETPLHSAAKSTNQDKDQIISVITDLLKRGADINARDKANRETPLHIAARRGSQGAVEALLSFNNPVIVTDSDQKDLNPPKPTANVNSENFQKYTPLSIAVRHRWTDIVRLMLERASPSPDLSLRGPIDNTKRTVTVSTLENAVRKGNIEIVKLFLEPTRSTNKEIDTAWSSDLRCTPLTWAVKEGNLELTKTLLQSGAGINVQDGDMLSPVHMASRRGHDAVMKYLLQQNPKPKIDLKAKDDWTALHYASSAGYDKIVQLLLDGHANPCARTKQAKTRHCDTPLSLALSKFHVKSIQVLLGCLKSDSKNKDSGWEGRYLGLEDVNDYRARYTFDAMKWAAENSEIHELVKFVLKQQYYLDLCAFGHENAANDISLTERKSTNLDRMIFNLRNRIGDILEMREDSRTPLEWAVYCGKLELVERLLVSSNNAHEVQRNAKRMVETIREEIRRYKKEIQKEKEEEEEILRVYRIWFGYGPLVPENNSEEEDDAAEELRWNADTTPQKSTTSASFTVKEGSGLPITDHHDLHEKLSDMEEDYIDIQDALQYGIPLDPGIVKITDLDKGLTAPSLDQNIRGSIGDFFAGIVDVYKDDGGVALLRRSRKVENVIYDKGPRAIMESARARIIKSQATQAGSGTTLKEEDLQLRWVHLPANNMQWMEDLTSRLRLDKSPDNEVTPNRPNTYVDSQDFLQRSWHQLPMGDSRVHFMKPTCVKLIIDPKLGNTKNTDAETKQESNLESSGNDTSKPRSKPELNSQDDTPNSLALYMPYFTFSTLTKEECNPNLTQQTEEDADSVEENPPPSYRQSGAFRNPIVRIIRALRHMIQLVQPRTRDAHTDGLPVSEAKPTLSLINQAETYQKLIKAYENGGGILHSSQTLDEYFYHSLSDKAAQRDLELRNQTQVTSKRIRDVAIYSKCQGDWTIIRVDHLWLWIIDDKTIISSSTHRLDKIPDPILEGIWKYMNSAKVQSGRAELPCSSYQMAQFITEFCIDFFHNATCKVGQVEESIPEIYKNAINKISRDEARLLEKFAKKISSVLSSLTTAGPQDAEDLDVQAKQQVKSNIKSIQKASELLNQIKDIRDELNMLKSVLTQQKSVWNELHDRRAGKHNLRGPAYAINNIDEMDTQATRVQDAVLAVLGLEQNETSIQEAITSREQARESIRQGRTLMAFTVVTIFFLPGSFLVALFALNIAIFPHSGDNVVWPRWAFAIIFGLTVALLTIIMTVAFYLDNVKQFAKRLDDKTRPDKTRPKNTSTSAV